MSILKQWLERDHPRHRGGLFATKANSEPDPGLLNETGLESALDRDMSVATNPRTPPEVLRDIAAAGDWRTLSWVASNPNAPADVLKKAAQSGDSLVLTRVASNPSSDPYDLHTLTWHAHRGIRAQVATNPSTDERDLFVLAHDEDVQVQSALCEHPALPLAVRRELEQSQFDFIREKVWKAAAA